MSKGHTRKRTNSSVQQKVSPVKRRRASGNVPADATQLEASDIESGAELVDSSSKDVVVDEDGSFFFPPPKLPTANENESCIKFVDVLPSEVAATSTVEDEANGSEIDDTHNTGNRRVTRSAGKLPQPRLPAQAPSATPPAVKRKRGRPRKTSSSENKPEPKSKIQQPRKASVSESKSKKSAVQDEAPKLLPKLTLKLSGSFLSTKAVPQVQYGEDSDEHEHDDYEEQVQERVGEYVREHEVEAEAKVKATDLAFAVEMDGANETIELPRDVEYDRFQLKLAILLDKSISQMKLAYLTPGMKKSDRLHLKTAAHFEGMMLRANNDIDAIHAKLEAVCGAGKRAMDQRERLTKDLATYMITIIDLAEPKPGAKTKQGEGSNSKANTKENSGSPHQRAYEFIKFQRPKCKTCQENCGIIPMPGRDPVHVTLTEECMDLWARLSAMKSCSHYSPNPPEQVLSLLRTKFLARSRNTSTDSPASEASNNKQLVVTSNRTVPETSLPFSNSTSLGQASAVSASTNNVAASSSVTPAPFGVVTPQMLMNSMLFSAAGQGGGLGASVLPSLSNQMSQFSQSPMLVYNMPQGFGFGMGTSGFPGVQMASLGGFPIIQLGGGMFQGPSGDAEQNE